MGTRSHLVAIGAPSVQRSAVQSGEILTEWRCREIDRPGARLHEPRRPGSSREPLVASCSTATAAWPSSCFTLLTGVVIVRLLFNGQLVRMTEDPIGEARAARSAFGQQTEEIKEIKTAPWYTQCPPDLAGVATAT